MKKASSNLWWCWVGWWTVVDNIANYSAGDIIVGRENESNHRRSLSDVEYR